MQSFGIEVRVNLEPRTVDVAGCGKAPVNAMVQEP